MVPKSDMSHHTHRWAALPHIALLCIMYIGAARIGLLFATPPEPVSPVWPLSGLVFVALLRGGIRLWPGVFLGEFVNACWIGLPYELALGLAATVTLEIVLGLLLLRPVIGATLDLDSLRKVLAFLVVTTLVSVPLAAAGAAGLFTAQQHADWAYAWQIWRAWWIGDVMGILAVTPIALTLPSLRIRRRNWPRIVEGGILYGLLLLITIVVMRDNFNYSYILIVCIVWIALRFGPRGNAVAIALVCSITVWLTAMGQGPFVISVRSANLFFLQTFLTVMTATGLIVSALIAERTRSAEAARLMADIAVLLMQPADEARVLRSVADRLATWAGGCSIALLELDGRLHTITTAFAEQDQSGRAASPALEEAGTLRSRALTQRQAILNTEHGHGGRQTAMAAPLIAYGHPLGVITLFSTDPGRTYRHADLRHAQTAANRIAEAITTTRLAADLERLHKLEALGRLAGSIAHDFNNLLTVMIGHTELALSLMDADSPARAELDTVVLTVQRARTLVRELRVVGHPEPAPLQEVSLNTLVQQSDPLIRALIQPSITLIYELAPETGRCTVDPGQIERVIVNLAANACDAMPHGGRITIATGSCGPAEPVPADLRPGRYATLSVRDTGSGIAPEILGRIFEPYFSTKNREKGSGLGLAICYNIVKQFHGTIAVQSEVGHGTQFVVYLPEQPADSADAHGESL